MKKWQIQKPNPEVVRQFMVQSDLSALSASVLAARNIRTVEEAAAFLCCDGLSDPFLTADMQEAAQALNEAIDAGTKICVYGDYDCDGVVSTVILYTYLMELGADVTWYIPERAEGYGMNADSLRRLQKEGVACIVTVDNGIAALEEAELLAELGITLIITDHHQPSDGKLPRARAVVDPHRADSNDVFRPLCGAGVALKLIMAMEDGDATIAMEEFGELAAIATVADVVPLQGENRYLVQQGLQLLANTERPGLLALLDVAGLTGKKLTATSIAYSLAPRINAAGRFGSPRQAVELLLCEDPEEAHALADQLEQCNRQRKEVEEQILQEMIAQTEQHPELLQQRVLILAGANWHHGVIGIVAARLEERFGKPAIVITLEGETARGSMRSFGAFSAFACLDACKDCLTRYGGHPGAGGFSMQADQVDAFREAVARYAANAFPQMPSWTMQADRLLLPQDITQSEIASLDQLAPFGEGNPTPLFALCHAVLKELVPLSGGKHTKLRFLYGTTAMEALLFRTAPEEVLLKPESVFDLLVTAEINTYRGRQSVSLLVQDYRKSGIVQAKYFHAKASYEQFCRGEALPAAYYAAMLPSRAELIAVYQALQQEPIGLDALFFTVQEQGINYCKMRIALESFVQSGLAAVHPYWEQVKKLPVQKKVVIEEAPILRDLQNKIHTAAVAAT